MLRKRNKICSKRKNVVISSIVPIIILLVIGGIWGKDWFAQNMKNQIENTNVLGSSNEISNNIVLNEIETNEINEIEESNTVVEDERDTDNSNKISNNTDPSDNSEKQEEEPEQEPEEEPSNSNKNTKFDETVAFIGDSRTQGFIMYNGLKNVQDYSYIGLMVDTAVTKEFVKTSNGEKITLIQDMKNKNIEKVYIMLGVNELGWSYPSVFKLKYEELIDEIRKVKPNCKIYVQSIIPVTKSKDQSDKIYNNTNVKKFNKLIKEVANEKNVKYLDVQSVLINSQGYLPEEASTDGIHIGKTYCEKWLNYLKNNS